MDNDVLTNEQTEKVLQFQDITGLEDLNICRDILIRHGWDLEVSFFNGLYFVEIEGGSSGKFLGATYGVTTP